MFFLPWLITGAIMVQGIKAFSNRPKTATPTVPSPASSQVVESEEAIRKRLQKTGRSSTIFTGGLFDNPAGRKERLIPV